MNLVGMRPSACDTPSAWVSPNDSFNDEPLHIGVFGKSIFSSLFLLGNFDYTSYGTWFLFGNRLRSLF